MAQISSLWGSTQGGRGYVIPQQTQPAPTGTATPAPTAPATTQQPITASSYTQPQVGSTSQAGNSDAYWNWYQQTYGRLPSSGGTQTTAYPSGMPVVGSPTPPASAAKTI